MPVPPALPLRLRAAAWRRHVWSGVLPPMRRAGDTVWLSLRSSMLSAFLQRSPIVLMAAVLASCRCAKHEELYNATQHLPGWIDVLADDAFGTHAFGTVKSLVEDAVSFDHRFASS